MSATAILLNWQRPENQKKVIASIRNQNRKVLIFLWNNNIKDTFEYDCDLRIDSDKNLFCLPRWLMSFFTKTDYIFTLDDDLMFKDKNVISDCIDYFEKNNLPDDTILGNYGVIFNQSKDYWHSDHVKDVNKDVFVDVVKGRFMFLKKGLMNMGFVNCNSIRGDDIYVSSFSRHKIVPAFLKNRFKNLDQGDVALWKQADHKNARQEAVNNYFGVL